MQNTHLFCHNLLLHVSVILAWEPTFAWTFSYKSEPTQPGLEHYHSSTELINQNADHSGHSNKLTEINCQFQLVVKYGVFYNYHNFIWFKSLVRFRAIKKDKIYNLSKLNKLSSQQAPFKLFSEEYIAVFLSLKV